MLMGGRESLGANWWERITRCFVEWKGGHLVAMGVEGLDEVHQIPV